MQQCMFDVIWKVSVRLIKGSNYLLYVNEVQPPVEIKVIY